MCVNAVARPQAPLRPRIQGFSGTQVKYKVVGRPSLLVSISTLKCKWEGEKKVSQCCQQHCRPKGGLVCMGKGHNHFPALSAHQPECEHAVHNEHKSNGVWQLMHPQRHYASSYLPQVWCLQLPMLKHGLFPLPNAALILGATREPSVIRLVGEKKHIINCYDSASYIS